MLPARLKRMLDTDLGRLAGSSAFIYALRIAGAGLTFVTQLLLVRWMGAEELGEFVFAFATATTIAFVCTLGLPVVAIRFVTQAIEKGDHAAARGFLHQVPRLIALSCGVAVVIGIALIVWTSNGATWDQWLTRLFGVAMIPVSSMLIAQTDIGRSLLLMSTAFVPTMLMRHVLVFVAVVALHLSGVALNSAWVAGLTLLAMTISALWQFSLLRHRMKSMVENVAPTFETRRWISAGLPLMFAFGFSGFFLEINVAVAGLFVPPAELAVYNLGFQIVNLAGFFLTAVGYQFSPHAARLHAQGDREGLQRIVTRATALRFGFTLLVLMGIAVMGPFILAVFGPEFAASYHVLLLIAATQVTAGLFGPVDELMAMFGLEKTGVIVAAIALTTDLVLTLLLAPLYGITGTALAVLATMVVWDLILFLAVWRATGIQSSVLGLLNPHVWARN